VQQFLGSVFQKLMKAWSWILIIVLVVLIKLSSFYPAFIEQYYSNGIYPVISRFLRILFGWIPFSFGDFLYAFFVAVIVLKTVQTVRAVVKRKFNRQYFLTGLKQIIFFFLLLYVFFYVLWGLNYNRKGITSQLKLDVKEYSVQDLDTLIRALQSRVNYWAAKIDTTKRDSTLKRSLLFRKGVEAYGKTREQIPFLEYDSPSLKTSLYSPVGHFFGFSGYYNPFSGEAQVKSDYPRFLQPFIITHEIGHQLGYAKEDEASFVGFIVCRSYEDADFRYSMYFDIYLSASFEMLLHDPKKFLALKDSLHPRAKEDYRALRRYLSRKKNIIEPFATRFYSEYLRANNQPLGKRTYDMVSYWLIAYYKKYGIDAL
jgi:hypothetical protein